MVGRAADGSAGDADYGAIGTHYADYRRPEQRIAQLIYDALGNAQTVLNIGAGAGSYEPVDRDVTAVEPSSTMRRQRPAQLPTAVDATAENLPFADDSFDAAMTTFSVHQWTDLIAGLTQMRRVTTGPVVILTCDPLLVQRFWLNDYAPDVLAAEARRYPQLSAIADILGGTTAITSVPIPLDCHDGFNEAYYGRPEMLLNPDARRSCSAWSFVLPELDDAYSIALRDALTSGTWDVRYSQLRTQHTYQGSLVLIVNTRSAR